MDVFAMTEIPWDELTAVTVSLEKLCGDRTTARYIGSEQLRDYFQTQVDDLRERRKRHTERGRAGLAANGDRCVGSCGSCGRRTTASATPSTL